MKKIFFNICIVALATSGIFAQKVTFPVDNRGRICFTNEYQTDLSKVELMESVSAWAVTTFRTNDVIFSKDEAKGEIMVNGNVKSKSSYNPFACTFNEYVNFVIKFVVDEGKIAYTLYRPILTETYAGYGTNSKTSNMDDMYTSYMQAYSNINAAKNNPSLSKRDQKAIIKAAETVINETEERLGEAAKSLLNVTKILEYELFR